MNKFETDCLFSRNGKTVSYGTKSISALAPKIWNLVPLKLGTVSFPTNLKKKCVHGQQKGILSPLQNIHSNLVLP